MEWAREEARALDDEVTIGVGIAKIGRHVLVLENDRDSQGVDFHFLEILPSSPFGWDPCTME